MYNTETTCKGSARSVQHEWPRRASAAHARRERITMQSIEKDSRPRERQRLCQALKKLSGLQTRMTLSYVGVSAATVLLIELVGGTTFLIVAAHTPGAKLPHDVYLQFLKGWFVTALFLLVILAPVGSVFGFLTTRGLVRRIHRLVLATDRFASGDYSQRVMSAKQDEVGQLERQFNTMAEQLVESIAQQQRLTEQHVRLEERARIEQELRTAQFIQRALLPKEVPGLAYWRIMPYYRPAREVGGDFYDFLPFDDGRLGIVIGDATDKGVSAALLMATTCTMLRTAAHGDVSPGEVLARVNTLLADSIPSGMFATCFYALLDPASGRLRYANAGHDLPYRYCQGSVGELYATGMPLGMMAGTRYEEREATLAPGEGLLFYSDGLVEAHNAQRDMFGFPRLKSLLQSDHPDGSTIDFLMNELQHFTGAGWEQEDDVTLLTLHNLHTPA
jgi:serine phosphatase RsbU (regulator of sigma subunit)